MRKLVVMGYIAISFMATGCATSLNAKIAPGMRFDSLGQTYVARFAPDDRNLNQTIASELTNLGYPATAGEAGQMPASTDTLVTYEDKWMWDMSMYLKKITIDLKDAQTGKLIATGDSSRTSLVRKSPEYMINETLEKILEKNAQK